MPPLYAPQQEPVQDNSNLEYEIQRLTQEVEQLRRDQVERELPPDPQPSPQITASPPTPAPPRTLVFRDGRRLTIHNYAIVGQMLWVMDENSTKIPLAELDIDATERENRGLGLRLPRP
jgi:hypothetical protein